MGGPIDGMGVPIDEMGGPIVWPSRPITCGQGGLVGGRLCMGQQAVRWLHGCAATIPLLPAPLLPRSCMPPSPCARAPLTRRPRCPHWAPWLPSALALEEASALVNEGDLLVTALSLGFANTALREQPACAATVVDKVGWGCCSGCSSVVLAAVGSALVSGRDVRGVWMLPPALGAQGAASMEGAGGQ